ncbi:hypothetical protein B0T17DRAFT_613140 [Bombardia bombarda]|uniref:Serum paraoxonase/arylesterase family protein n=1 Tax=Bombardia bombarda TaxID=252184 RepID=A0AA39XNS8_9PEZI|nr:hypothetical protein B0T17DRAFT_613140 [Bombardia bombarda]
MRNPSLLTTSLAGALLAYVLYTWGGQIQRSLTVLGVFRWYPDSSHTSEEIISITDTTHCEDIHYHAPTDTLFTACEDNPETRFKWFPALANFDDPALGARSRGSIHVINPQTMQSRRLAFENFEGPFVTHGIDVISDRDRPDGEAVYIFAVNHVPNPDLPPSESVQGWPKARSQIEIFHHVIGSPSIQHLRSVWHPLIRTPNDLFAVSPTSFYVTNDHHYTDHGIMRSLEDLYDGAKWTDVIYVEIDSAETNTMRGNAGAGVEATQSLKDMHNANGMGHGRSVWEVLLASCTSGVLHIGQISPEQPGKIDLLDQVAIDSVVDNPSYFSDPFAKAGDDRSGFLLPGVSRGVTLASTQRDPSAKDPAMVWFVRPAAREDKIKEPSSPLRWEKRLLFEDDGTRMRSASGAVLVAIDPSLDPEIGAGKGRRKAWLFVTGFLSKNVIAIKVDL